MSPSTTEALVSPTEEQFHQQLLAAEILATEAWNKFISAPFAQKETARGEFLEAEKRRNAFRQQLASANR